MRKCRELRVVGRLGVKMIGMAGAWVLRPFGGAADHALVEELWSAALEPRWPLLLRAIAMVRDGFLAMDPRARGRLRRGGPVEEHSTGGRRAGSSAPRDWH
jgi:hypothetical protein